MTLPPILHKRLFKMPATRLMVVSAAFIIVANNGALFSVLSQRLDMVSVQGAAFVLSIYLVLTAVISLVFFLVGHKYTLKPIILFFIILSAVLSYFTQQLGAIFDVDMIRNIAETIRDNNRQEAMELMSFPLVLHVLLWGIVPSLVVFFVEPVYKPRRKELLTRAGYAMTMLAVVAIMVWANYKFVTFFVRENRHIRVYTVPTYPIYALDKYRKTLRKAKDVPFQVIGEDAHQEKVTDRKVVGIMVVGETARADHFSLNGYKRKTNPLLEKWNLINFTQVTSSGTSTAYSVPSMFSFMPPRKYSPEKANKISNVLDVLSRAGVSVFWIENNSSSKGVADRIETINLRADYDTSSPLYSDGGYFDEALVTYLDECIDSTEKDVLIVLHTMGSHGPTYHKRYTEAFAQFEPDCQSDSPQECSNEEVINAYDNTILYTDFVLNQLIEHLEANRPQYESFLLYASDHGESLGEDGIYLHGLPSFLAPDAQTHVPMFAWLSEEYAASREIPLTDTKTDVDTPYSHDNISHTLLGMTDVKTEIYEPELDLFSAYR